LIRWLFKDFNRALPIKRQVVLLLQLMKLGRIIKKKVVTYFKKISFTFPDGNENLREVDQVDSNSSKTRLEGGNKREEERKSKKFRRL